jgi:hypothetical protein
LFCIIGVFPDSPPRIIRISSSIPRRPRPDGRTARPRRTRVQIQLRRRMIERIRLHRANHTRSIRYTHEMRQQLADPRPRPAMQPQTPSVNRHPQHRPGQKNSRDDGSRFPASRSEFRGRSKD